MEISKDKKKGISSSINRGQEDKVNEKLMKNQANVQSKQSTGKKLKHNANNKKKNLKKIIIVTLMRIMKIKNILI